jgi:hypothetical protein
VLCAPVHLHLAATIAGSMRTATLAHAMCSTGTSCCHVQGSASSDVSTTDASNQGTTRHQPRHNKYNRPTLLLRVCAGHLHASRLAYQTTLNRALQASTALRHTHTTAEPTQHTCTSAAVMVCLVGLESHVETLAGVMLCPAKPPRITAPAATTQTNSHAGLQFAHTAA